MLLRRNDPATNVYTFRYDDAGRLVEGVGVKGTNVVAGWPYRYGYDRAWNRIRQTEGQKQRDLIYNADNQLIKSERTNTLSVRGFVNEPGSQVSVRTSAFTNWVPATTRFISHTQAYYEAHNVRTATNLSLVTNTVFVRATDPAGHTSTSTVKVVTTGPASTRTYTYDADGNLVFYKLALDQQTNTWDAENRLIRIDYTNGNTRMRYDGWGRLREVAEYNTTNTLTNLVRYVWNGFLPWAELNSTNGVIRTFTWGLDLSGTVGGAGGIGGLVGIRNYIPGSNYLVRSNGRGDVTEVRRTNGTVAASYGYSPFGQLLYQTNTLAQPYRFSTRLTHGRSGYVYFLGRWYASDVGVFLSRDSIQENDGIQLYQYAYANPSAVVDPNGLWGVQFGSVNLGVGNPWMIFDDSSWGDIGRGAAATADGVLTAATAGGLLGLFDPNLFSEYYDPCDISTQWSHGLGQAAFTIGTVAFALPQGAARGGMQTVTHWGPRGMSNLRSGDWVMTGGSNARNWIMSGMKYKPWNSISKQVPISTLKPVPASEPFSAVKTAIGQRIYKP